MLRQAGAKVWVPREEGGEVWAPGEVVEVTAVTCTVRLEDGSRLELPISATTEPLPLQNAQVRV
jgi:hypothetical protein